MVTLMKRASKGQHKVWRIVKGAVRDTAHVHGVELPYSFCTSVAKRATGTLTAQMPDVLAAASVPVRQTGCGAPEGQSQRSRLAQISQPADRSRLLEVGQKKGPRSPVKRGPLLRFLKDAPSIMWWLKRNDPEAYAYMQQALQNVGKIVGRLDAAEID